jgi:predicted nucleotidyltransferase component of viral defense system
MTKYSNALNLRAALEDRILAQSKKTGIDIQRLRRDIAFDRLIVRLFQMPSPPWVLKGGYAMQLRTDSARTTKDVDLSIRDANLIHEDPEKRNQTVRDLIIKQAALEIGDHFAFKISNPVRELDAPPEGGARFHIEVLLADRSFEKFHLDIGAGDVWSEPLENLISSKALEFAGFKSVNLPAISKEQQFAEKLHAYTLVRSEDRPNSRVKDLIDMNLLINAGLNEIQLKAALAQTFERRNTHALLLDIAVPPESWIKLYPKMAEECGLNANLETGFTAVAQFVRALK